MSAQNKNMMAKQSITFFDLPSEIREEIYRLYCNSSPRTSGSLEGYIDFPLPAPLAVSRRMRNEIMPTYYKSVKKIIFKDRVCFKLGSSDVENHFYFAGWTIWSNGGRRSFNTWTRHGPEDQRYAAWWVDTIVLELAADTQFNHAESLQNGWKGAQIFAERLVKLMKLEQLYNSPAAMRLMNVYCRVRKAIEEADKKRRNQVEPERSFPDFRQPRSMGPPL